MGTTTPLHSQDSSPWKLFEFYARRFQTFSSQLAAFQRALIVVFTEGSSESLNYPLHRSQVVEMTTFWTSSQETLIELFLDVPANKRRLLSKYVDTLTRNLPLIDEKSCALQQNQGELSVLMKDAQKAFTRVSAKLEERARWYRVHPILKSHAETSE